MKNKDKENYFNPFLTIAYVRHKEIMALKPKIKEKEVDKRKKK